MRFGNWTGLVLALMVPALQADQVSMKNGDRLTGSILKFDGKNLSLKADLAGVVAIPWDAVVAITADAPLHVGLQDGQVVVGTISTRDGRLVIQTRDAGAVTASRESVKFIRSQQEQTAFETEVERYRNPRLVDLWTGHVDLGFSRTQGNADTETVTVGANASRATTRDKLGVAFTSLYSASDATGRRVVTANAIRGGLNYSLNVNPRSFAFGSVDLEFDEFQRLDLRFAPAGGFGYKVAKTEATVLDLLGGASLNREFFSSGLRRTSGEALLGNELVHKISPATSLRQKFVLFPNLTNTGSYRINFDASAVTALRKWLGWHLTLSDRFLSNPVAGRRKNDILFTTGIRLTFAK